MTDLAANGFKNAQWRDEAVVDAAGDDLLILCIGRLQIKKSEVLDRSGS